MVSLLIGVFYGAMSGYAGGRTDMVMMRIVDILYALPFTVFVIILMVFFGRNIIFLFMAIGAVEWLTTARIARGQTLSLRQREFCGGGSGHGIEPYPHPVAAYHPEHVQAPSSFTPRLPCRASC